MKSPMFLLLAVCLGSMLRAELKVAPLFSDHMVLQRNSVVPVWGTASPGEKIMVVFANQKLETTADGQGRWKVGLRCPGADATGRELIVNGSRTVVFVNVVVGDVWLAGGQSNMDSPLHAGSAAEAIPQSADPLLRFLIVKKEVAIEPQSALSGKWESSSPQTVPNFSAVAWFFAREIRKAQGIPVGVISAAWGGTPVKTWMGLEMLKPESAFEKQLAEWNQAFSKHEKALGQPQLMGSYYREMQEWVDKVETPYKAALKTYAAEVSAAKAAGLEVPQKPRLARPEPEMPDPLARPAPSKRPSVPSHAFNAMIAPLASFPVKGFLWYQGEADLSHPDDYRKLFPRLIEGWRSLWGRADLPFLFVQLPGNGTDEGIVATQGIPFLRDSQASALSLPATGMAVTLDIGDANNVHPDNKIHVGHRLALIARQKVYGEKIESSGPFYHSHEIKNGTVRVSFKYAESGLMIGDAPWRPSDSGAAKPPSEPASKPPGLARASSSREEKLLGFALCGADGKWVNAEARIESNQVVVHHPAVPEPVGLAYGWSATPRVNLYNKTGLPAAPFRVAFNAQK